MTRKTAPGYSVLAYRGSEAYQLLHPRRRLLPQLLRHPEVRGGAHRRWSGAAVITSVSPVTMDDVTSGGRKGDGERTPRRSMALRAGPAGRRLTAWSGARPAVSQPRQAGTRHSPSRHAGRSRHANFAAGSILTPTTAVKRAPHRATGATRSTPLPPLHRALAASGSDYTSRPPAHSLRRRRAAAWRGVPVGMPEKSISRRQFRAQCGCWRIRRRKSASSRHSSAACTNAATETPCSSREAPTKRRRNRHASRLQHLQHGVSLHLHPASRPALSVALQALGA